MEATSSEDGLTVADVLEQLDRLTDIDPSPSLGTVVLDVVGVAAVATIVALLVVPLVRLYGLPI